MSFIRPMSAICIFLKINIGVLSKTFSYLLPHHKLGCVMMNVLDGVVVLICKSSIDRMSCKKCVCLLLACYIICINGSSPGSVKHWMMVVFKRH